MAFNINTDSADWREIQRWAEQQIAECHARLERCTQIETPYFQGRIAQLRALLDAIAIEEDAA